MILATQQTALLTFLNDLAESVQEDFEKLIFSDNNKKKFIKDLSKILALLLNTNVNTIGKIKTILKISIETTLIIWQGPKRQKEDSQQLKDAILVV